MLRPGQHLLQGRAWSGHGPITSVEVTVDDGVSWAPAVLDEPLDTWAWRRWSLPWHVQRPGRYLLSARATDDTGRTQPTDAPWNRGGFSNTAPQRVPVVVVE